MTQILGEGAFWGNAPVLAESFVYQRTLGTEPDSCVITFDESQFRSFAATLDPRRFNPVTQGPISGLVEGLASQVVRDLPAVQARVPYVADLIFGFVLGGDPTAPGNPRQFAVKNMYLSEVELLEDDVAIDDPLTQAVVQGGQKPQQNSQRLVRVSLVDIRRWWANFGEITRDFNVRLDDGTLDVSSKVLTSSVSNPQPWSLLQIFQFLLNSLPGGFVPTGFPSVFGGTTNAIRSFPAGTVAGVERELQLWGARPKIVLDQLLHDYDLAMGLNLDGSVAIYERGQGKVGEVPGGDGFDNSDDPSVVWEGFTLRDGTNKRTTVDSPTEVIYVAGPKVWSVQVDYLIPALYRELVDENTGVSTLQIIDATVETLTAIAQGRNPFEPKKAVSGEKEEGFIDPRLFLRLPFNEALWETAISFNAMKESRKAQILGKVDANRVAKEALAAAENPDFDRMDRELSEIVKRQFMRVYRLPRNFSNLLPLQDRAERFQRVSRDKTPGDRKPMTLEGFSFAATEFEVTDAALGVGGGDKRTVEERQFQILHEELSRVQQLQKRVENETEKGIAQFFKAITTLDVTAAAVKEDIKKKKRLQPLVTGTLSPAAIKATDEFSGSVLKDMGDTLRSSVSSVLGLDATVPRDKLLETLQAEEKRLVTEINKLADTIDPFRPRIREVRLLQGRINRQERATGLPADELRAELEKKLVPIEKDRRDLTKRKELKRPNKVRVHVNRGRRPLGFRVIDAKEGLIEVTETLPVWIAEPTVADPSESAAYPMPVRLTFGTFNPNPRQDPTKLKISPRGALSENEWMRVLRDAVFAAAASFKTYFAGTGHVLPPDPVFVNRGLKTKTQTKFTFNKRDRSSGKATIGPFPWLIRDSDQVQELIELDGTTNREKLLTKATKLARQILSADAEKDSGQLVIAGPRPVNVNGKVTGVQITLTPEGFETVVSLAAETEPLPDVVKPSRGQDVNDVGNAVTPSTDKRLFDLRGNDG